MREIRLTKMRLKFWKEFIQKLKVIFRPEGIAAIEQQGTHVH